MMGAGLPVLGRAGQTGTAPHTIAPVREPGDCGIDYKGGRDKQPEGTRQDQSHAATRMHRSHGLRNLSTN